MPMLRKRITTTGNSAALGLSQEILGLMGVTVGDEVELELVDRTLLVRPVKEVDRAERVQFAMTTVLRSRRRLLSRLAEGVRAPRPKRKR